LFVHPAVDAKHHLIVEHEVTNVGNDHGQLSKMALSAKTVMGKTIGVTSVARKSGRAI
jgi:hypothetical protein